MADFSFGGEGLLEGLQVRQSPLRQAQEQQGLEKEQALFPFQLAEAQGKAADAQLKFLSDKHAFDSSQVFSQKVQNAMRTGQLASLKPQELDVALSHYSLESDMPAQAAEYAGKAATAAKDEATEVKTKLDNVTSYHNVISSHTEVAGNADDFRQGLLDSAVDLASAGADPKLVDSLQKAAGRVTPQNWQSMKKEYGIRITNAQQRLDGQLKAAQLKKAGIDQQLDLARLRKENADADRSEMTAAYQRKHGGVLTATSSIAPGSVESKLLGALQKANISIPGGYSGAMLGERLQGYMDATPRLPDEPIDAYVNRVAQATVAGHAQLASSVSAGRRVGTTAGGVSIATASIMAPGGVGSQYLEAIDNANLSAFAPLRKGQELYRGIVSDPQYAQLVTAAQGLANDYQQVMARGGMNVDAQKQARKIINITSPAAAKANYDQMIREMQAVESGAWNARMGLGRLQTESAQMPGPPQSGAPKTLTYDPATGTFK